MKARENNDRPELIYSGARKPRTTRAGSQFQNPQKDELQTSEFKMYTKVESEDPVFASVTTGSLKIGTLSGTLVATAGVVAGSGTTTDVPEGTRLYYTDERVDDRVAALIQNGTGITWTYNDGAGTLTANVSAAGFALDDLANTSLADPNADRIVFWDDSAGLFTFLVPNTGLSITGTDLNVSLSAFSGTSPTFAGLTLSSMTEGSVLFAGASGAVTQDNANFFWNDSTNVLTLGGGMIQKGSANNRATNNKILYGETTDAATAVELTTDGAAGSGATNRISVPNNTALSVVLNICVKQSGSANARQMLRQFVISNNGGTTALQGAVTALGTDLGSAGLATVTTTITANDTDDCIKVEVNGVLATNLRFTAYVVSTEVLYA